MLQVPNKIIYPFQIGYLMSREFDLLLIDNVNCIIFPVSISDFPWVNHVLRCENEGTQYEVDGESRRRSCITPVALQDENEVAVLFYKFVCKTSCYRGMQRRPVVVIFTLEDVL